MGLVLTTHSQPEKKKKRQFRIKYFALQRSLLPTSNWPIVGYRWLESLTLLYGYNKIPEARHFIKGENAYLIQSSGSSEQASSICLILYNGT